MKVLREVNDVQLNEGNLMAKGLNNLYNEKTGELSFWFDDDVKDAMMKLPDDIFLQVARLHFQKSEVLSN
jgi:hypothetical protein